MTRYRMNDMRPGLKVEVADEPCIVAKVDFNKPGKGQAQVHVICQNLMTGRTVKFTMTRKDSQQAADIVETEVTFLHREGDLWYFFDQNTHEHHAVDARAMTDAAKWLTGQETCLLTIWNGSPLLVVAPSFVELEVTQVDSWARGNTRGSSSKPATLETGAVVHVPSFVVIGDTIEVDTRSGEYVKRIAA